MPKEREKSVLKPGLVFETSVKVTETQTALHMGSGKRQVLATPALVALMEAVAQEILDVNLPEGWESIGTGIELTHDAMTPVGMSVKIRAELIHFDGKEAVFDVSAQDGHGSIGSGRHHRMLARSRTLERMLGRKP